MVILIGGASHTGKTLLAQHLMQKYGINYLSIDHLKMGLIRSGATNLTPEDDEELTPYLWGIVKEIVKTAVENKQNLIIEGCYIPFDWNEYFPAEYLQEIKYYCLVMSKAYLKNNFEKIKAHANAAEKRLNDYCDLAALLADNAESLRCCREHGLNYILIDDVYSIDEIAGSIKCFN